MKHEFAISDEQEKIVVDLCETVKEFTGGHFEVITVKKLVTEDERLAGILDSLLNHKEKSSLPTNKGGTAAKPWTIVETGEKIGDSTMSKRITEGKLAEGTQVFHETRGNLVVDRKDNGSLTLRKAA
jgi:hypothetical protein